MKAPLDLQPAYVLHSRLYRETSLLVDVFTQHHGIIPAIARGVRGQKSNVKRALLQPFQPILCRWRGRGELVSLTDIDSGGKSVPLTGQALYSGLYVNELLVRLLHRHDANEDLYNLYQLTINGLNSSEALEVVLRSFELTLLEELGYGLSLEYDIDGEQIIPERQYILTTQGMLQMVSDDMVATINQKTYIGKDLQDIAAENWHSPQVLKSAKHLMRSAINPLLGSKPIQSRKLFRSGSKTNDT